MQNITRWKRNTIFTSEYISRNLTNDDIDVLVKNLTTLKDHRRQKEYLTKLETLKHSWPYPDTKLRSEQLEND